VPNLDMVESVDNEKVIDITTTLLILSSIFTLHIVCVTVVKLLFQVANYLNKAVVGLGRKPLKVLVQVNTSGEECEYCIQFNDFFFIAFQRIFIMGMMLRKLFFIFLQQNQELIHQIVSNL
jgi:hypothetical protein